MILYYCYSAVTSLELFVPYLGLHIDLSQADYSQCSLHRAQLCHCVHVTMGVLQKLTRREMVRKCTQHTWILCNATCSKA